MASTIQPKTPGVFIIEEDAFPPSIVGVQTAVPAFIGYTAKAEKKKKSLLNQAVTIDSFSEYQLYFGGDCHLSENIKLFYENGGGKCYIVSVGLSGDTDGAVSLADLQKGVEVIGKHVGPTMLVVPEAVKLDKIGDFASLLKDMLDQCKKLRDRVAILDVYGADKLDQTSETFKSDRDQVIADFRQAVGKADAEALSYGAAYYPFLKMETGISSLLPPSAAMAGVYSQNDNSKGVWNAPASISLVGVAGPSIKINDEDQEDLNAPIDGKSICAIREFPSLGSVVWGARTLDGNSPDWRYIQVRRTIIYIEQSIKNAMQPFALAANDSKTWSAVTTIISNFLRNMWSQGALMGTTPEQAYTVECGLGSTMTAQDILNGDMFIEVKVALTRPAEFIVLRLRQRMQSS